MKADDAINESKSGMIRRRNTANVYITAKINRTGVLRYVDFEDKFGAAVPFNLILREDWEPVIDQCKSCVDFDTLLNNANYGENSAMKRFIRLVKSNLCTCDAGDKP